MTYVTDTPRRGTIRAFARDQEEERGDDLEERVSRLEIAIHELADLCREQWGEVGDRRRGYDARAAAYDAHPPVGGVSSLSELQSIYDDHYERQRLDQQREPLRGDPLAGLRSAAGFARDLSWHLVTN